MVIQVEPLSILLEPFRAPYVPLQVSEFPAYIVLLGSSKVLELGLSCLSWCTRL
jgi:hypothetical protein